MTELEILEGIRREMAAMPGHLGFYYKNLVTGFEYGIREEEIYGAASVIKFPLFLHVLAECEKGNMSLDDRIVTEESDKVPSCGALNMFTGSIETDIRTVSGRQALDIIDKILSANGNLFRALYLDIAREGYQTNVVVFPKHGQQIDCRLFGNRELACHKHTVRNVKNDRIQTAFPSNVTVIDGQQFLEFV